MLTDTKFRIWAGDGRGYQTAGDVLVNETNDGVSLASIWDEVREALALYNQERSAIANLLSYRTTQVGEAVPQSIGSEKFEEATEFGVPRGIGDIDFIKLGLSWRDYDLGLRMSWMYLRDATAEQVQNRITRAIEADNRLVTGTILNRLFSNTLYTNSSGIPVYGLYNADGQVPPAHLGQTFDGTHTHYLTTGSTTLDAEDIELALRHIRQHGYGGAQAARFLVLANPADVENSKMTTWRAGIEYATGKVPKFDFIVSSNAPAYLSSETVHGATPPAEYNGLEVTGSYASALLIESYFIPQGWVAVVASAGPNSNSNPIGFREHPNPAYQGLRMLPGHFQGYPLIESYMMRGFGVGVRHRGAAVALQITNSGTYTPPTTILT